LVGVAASKHHVDESSAHACPLRGCHACGRASFGDEWEVTLKSVAEEVDRAGIPVDQRDAVAW
jgi:hypothetical protein